MKSILFLFLLKFLTFIWCERVKVDVFYETLCPYCQNYFVNEIFPLIQTELATKITLRLFPYGNAIMQSNGSIKCQHGKKECEMNMIHACAISLYPRTETLEFIACMDSLNQNIKKCANETLGLLSYERLAKCKNGSKGIELMKFIARKSEEEGFNSVPWVKVNGKHDLIAQSNLMSAVCMDLKETPEICSKAEFVNRSIRRKSIGFCYKSRSRDVYSKRKNIRNLNDRA